VTWFLSRLRQFLSWLVEHPWPIVAALGSFVAILLFRRRSFGVKPVDVEIATRIARAEAGQKQAQDLEPVAQEIERGIANDQKMVERIETTLSKQEMQDASDDEIADWFTGSGL
jgi:hypothetical protein